MKKNKMTLSELERTIQAMQQQMEAERQRIAKVIADVLMTSDNARILGEYNDQDLKRLTKLLAEHIPECAKRLDAEKQARAQRQAQV